MQVQTVAKSNNLAQVSLSRLGETSRGFAQDSPKILMRWSLKRRVPILSEMHSRLSEEGSPKRDPAGSHSSHSSNSRLSEGSPPERGKPLV
ncbi:hypothetical protein DEO72_LG2g2793 [Vigna unguiculata]|uniref:Uncharacterized protein n=1 Tax=Vigna unguiculata TaxID=3917 RepID=A0A4D6L1V9_VIGUN|nr:hypothetical protein DEO72_LG2g2793 [Vigna unguiculata]